MQKVLKTKSLDPKFSRSFSKLKLGIEFLRDHMKTQNFEAILKARKELYLASEEYRKVLEQSPADTLHDIVRARGDILLMEAESLMEECSRDMRLFMEVVK